MGRYHESDWPLTLSGPIDYSKPLSITADLITGIYNPTVDGWCNDIAAVMLLTYSMLRRSNLGPMRILDGSPHTFKSVEALCPDVDMSASGRFQWDILMDDYAITEAVVRHYDVMTLRFWQVTTEILEWAAYHNTLIIVNAKMLFLDMRWRKYTSYTDFGKLGDGYRSMTFAVDEEIEGDLTISYLPGSDDRKQYQRLFANPGTCLLNIPFFTHEPLCGEMRRYVRSGEF